jgi:hypothetical protein
VNVLIVALASAHRSMADQEGPHCMVLLLPEFVLKIEVYGLLIVMLY